MLTAVLCILGVCAISLPCHILGFRAGYRIGNRKGYDAGFAHCKQIYRSYVANRK